MSLPIFQGLTAQSFNLLQTGWASQLNPVLSNPFNQMSLLKSVVLKSGDNTINHLLGRNLQGWMIVGQNASATFYDKQASNQTPNLTLVLNASAQVTVNLGVF